MSSNFINDGDGFLTLLETAMLLEADPRGEHSYALNEVDNEGRLKSKERDHNYYFTDKKQHPRKHVSDAKSGKSVNFQMDFETHRSKQDRTNFSDENLHVSSDSLHKVQGPHVLPQYLSKDSALDVVSFDETSPARSLSLDKIYHSSEKRMIPGQSDPDISRMSLQSDYNMEQSSSSMSLPNSPPFRDGGKRFDHTYAKKEFDKMQRDDLSFQKSLYYKSTFQDHSYGSFTSIDDEAQGGGIKRRRSDENINKLTSISFASEAFQKSPFLDHSYQSVKSKVKRHGLTTFKWGIPSNERLDEKWNSMYWREPSYLDHSYDKNCDNVEEIWFRARDVWARKRSVSISDSSPSRASNQLTSSDHSYVVPDPSEIGKCPVSSSLGKLSDSGTESFTEDEEDMIVSPDSNQLQLPRDHTYTNIR